MKPTHQCRCCVGKHWNDCDTHRSRVIDGHLGLSLWFSICCRCATRCEGRIRACSLEQHVPLFHTWAGCHPTHWLTALYIVGQGCNTCSQRTSPAQYLIGCTHFHTLYQTVVPIIGPHRSVCATNITVDRCKYWWYCQRHSQRAHNSITLFGATHCMVSLLQNGEQHSTTCQFKHIGKCHVFCVDVRKSECNKGALCVLSNAHTTPNFFDRATSGSMSAMLPVVFRRLRKRDQ